MNCNLQFPNLDLRIAIRTIVCLYLAKVVLIMFFEHVFQELFKKGSNFRCDVRIREGILLDIMRIEGRLEWILHYEPFMSHLVTIVEDACNRRRAPNSLFKNSMRHIQARIIWVYPLVSVRLAP